MQITSEIEHDRITPAFARLGDAANAVLADLARETAHTLQREMQGRLRRQTSGTGKTADAITVERSDDGFYRVTSGAAAGTASRAGARARSLEPDRTARHSPHRPDGRRRA